MKDILAFYEKRVKHKVFKLEDMQIVTYPLDSRFTSTPRDLLRPKREKVLTVKC